MNRADIVTCVLPGEYGKPRPSLVVQSDMFNPAHASISVCPLTSDLIEAPVFRVLVKPTAENGLKKESQVLVDKIMSVSRRRIGQVIGCLGAMEMFAVDRALKVWLDLQGLDLT